MMVLTLMAFWIPRFLLVRYVTPALIQPLHSHIVFLFKNVHNKVLALWHFYVTHVVLANVHLVRLPLFLRAIIHHLFNLILIIGCFSLIFSNHIIKSCGGLYFDEPVGWWPKLLGEVRGQQVGLPIERVTALAVNMQCLERPRQVHNCWVTDVIVGQQIRLICELCVRKTRPLDLSIHTFKTVTIGKLLCHLFCFRVSKCSILTSFDSLLLVISII